MSASVGTLSVYINSSGSLNPPSCWHREDHHGYQWNQGEIYIPQDAFPLEGVS